MTADPCLHSQVEVINTLQLLTAKPVIYLVNLSERDYIRKKNKYLPQIKAWIDENNPGDLLIPFSVEFEQRLADMGEEEALEEEKKVGATSALGKITTAGYASLNLIRFFTCGPDEVRAWTIREGTKAPQAAGVIHSDIEKNFICAEVQTYEDLKEHGTEAAVKAAGKLRQQGRTCKSWSSKLNPWATRKTDALVLCATRQTKCKMRISATLSTMVKRDPTRWYEYTRFESMTLFACSVTKKTIAVSIE